MLQLVSFKKGVKMSIESKLTYDKKQETYPILKVDSDNGNLVVMFTDKNQGFVVKGNLKRDIGEFRKDWIECNFETFNGEVVLKNK